MIPKLRKKFISITASALFMVILCVILAINALFIYQNNKGLDTRLSLMLGETDSNAESGSANTMPPEFNHPQQTIKGSDQFPFWKVHNPDSAESIPVAPPNNTSHSWENDYFPKTFLNLGKHLRIETGGCLIYLYTDGSLKEIRQLSPEKYSEDELLTIATEIYQKDSHKGWKHYFKYRMIQNTSEDTDPQIVIGMLNASADLYAIFSMISISLLIGVISFLALLVIIIFASNKAVKPIAESYIKQKQFVTDAGHELKTPLTVISANNELARMIYGDSEWFDGIDTQVVKLNHLVTNLITLAKADEEQQPIFSSFNLSDAVYDTAKSFENLIRTQDCQVSFYITDDILFTGDESKLRQIVSILMDNAVKYCSKQGAISITLKADKQIRLQVTNDCSAIDAIDLNHIFERFYRADKSRSTSGGYGLGLSIAKAHVELHKGTILAKALKNDRILFEVILPKHK